MDKCKYIQLEHVHMHYVCHTPVSYNNITNRQDNG